MIKYDMLSLITGEQCFGIAYDYYLDRSNEQTVLEAFDRYSESFVFSCSEDIKAEYILISYDE